MLRCGWQRVLEGSTAEWGGPYAVVLEVGPRAMERALGEVPELVFRRAGGDYYYLLGHPDIHPVTLNFHSRHAQPLVRAVVSGVPFSWREVRGLRALFAAPARSALVVARWAEAAAVFAAIAEDAARWRVVHAGVVELEFARVPGWVMGCAYATHRMGWVPWVATPQSLCRQRGGVAGYPGGAGTWAYHPSGNGALAPRGTLLRELVEDAAYVAGVPGFLESWVLGYPWPEVVVGPRRGGLPLPAGEGSVVSSGDGIPAPVSESQAGSASEVGSASVSGSSQRLSEAGSVSGASFLGSGETSSYSSSGEGGSSRVGSSSSGRSPVRRRGRGRGRLVLASSGASSGSDGEGSVLVVSPVLRRVEVRLERLVEPIGALEAGAVGAVGVEAVGDGVPECLRGPVAAAVAARHAARWVRQLEAEMVAHGGVLYSTVGGAADWMDAGLVLDQASSARVLEVGRARRDRACVAWFEVSVGLGALLVDVMRLSGGL